MSRSARSRGRRSAGLAGLGFGLLVLGVPTPADARPEPVAQPIAECDPAHVLGLSAEVLGLRLHLPLLRDQTRGAAAAPGTLRCTDNPIIAVMARVLGINADVRLHGSSLSLIPPGEIPGATGGGSGGGGGAPGLQPAPGPGPGSPGTPAAPGSGGPGGPGSGPESEEAGAALGLAPDGRPLQAPTTTSTTAPTTTSTSSTSTSTTSTSTTTSTTSTTVPEEERDADDEAVATAESAARGGVTVTAVMTPSEPAPGETATIQITVLNRGDEPADGLSLSNVSVGGADLRSASPSQGSCSVGGNAFVCDLGTLAPGSSAAVTAHLVVHPGSTPALLQRTSLSGASTPTVDLTLSKTVAAAAEKDLGGVPRAVVTATSLGLLATTAGVYGGERTYRRRRR